MTLVKAAGGERPRRAEAFQGQENNPQEFAMKILNRVLLSPT
jgi:hypothetical protein